MHKKLDLENTRIKNINIIYRMAKGFITRHRRKLRNKKSRSKRRIRGGNGILGWLSGKSQNQTVNNQPQYQQQNTNTLSDYGQGMNNMSSNYNGYGNSMPNVKSYPSRYDTNTVASPSRYDTNTVASPYNTGMGGKRRRPRRSARKVKRSVRKGRKSRRTRRMRGGSNGYTINGAGIGKNTSALANPIPFSAYPLNR